MTAQRFNYSRRATPAEMAAIRAAREPKKAVAANAITADATTLRALITGEVKPASAVSSAIPEYGLNRRHRVRDITFVDGRGDTWTESVATGWRVPKECEAAFWAVKTLNDAIRTHHADTGDSFSHFYVSDASGRIGHGYFDANVESEDIDYLAAKVGARWGLVVELARYHPEANALDLSSYGEAREPMPNYDCKPMSVWLRHRYYGRQLETLHFDLRDSWPSHFSAFWHARRDVHRRITAECRPSYFLVFDTRKRIEGAMPLFRVRDGAYHQIGEAHAADGQNWRHDDVAWGYFDETPSPEQLAWLDCRLAARGQYLALVPDERDFVPPAIADLMAGVTRTES